MKEYVKIEVGEQYRTALDAPRKVTAVGTKSFMAIDERGEEKTYEIPEVGKFGWFLERDADGHLMRLAPGVKEEVMYPLVKKPDGVRVDMGYMTVSLQMLPGMADDKGRLFIGFSRGKGKPMSRDPMYDGSSYCSHAVFRHHSQITVKENDQ